MHFPGHIPLLKMGVTKLVRTSRMLLWEMSYQKLRLKDPFVILNYIVTYITMYIHKKSNLDKEAWQ